MINPKILHYLAVGLAIAIGSIGSGIGQGLAAFSAVGSLVRQKDGSDQIFKSLVIGLAFIESGVILALVISLMMLFAQTTLLTLGIAIAEVGIAIMIGTAATAISISSSFAVQSSVVSISRQPIFAQKILTLMLVSQSMMEAPVIFPFIIALLIRGSFNESTTVLMGFKFLAATVALTLGAIGPSIGQGIFANSSCKSVGLNREAYSQLFSFSIINGAVIETPLIFALLVSILIIFSPLSILTPTSAIYAFIAAAFATGIGSIGTASAAGFVGSKTVRQIALAPENYSVLFRSNILAQAFIESSSIYALIVSLALITFFK